MMPVEARDPASMDEVADAWWDMLMNHALWRVRVADLPGYGPLNPGLGFAAAFRYQAKKRGLRSSVRLKYLAGDSMYAYVQAIPREIPSYAYRQPLEAAGEAPRPPKVVPPAPELPPLRRLDNSAVIQRLLAARTGTPPVPPVALLHHPVIGSTVGACECATEDFRDHTESCPVYPVLPLLEHQLKRLDMSPEEWARMYE